MPYFHGLLLGAGLAMEDKDGLEVIDAVQSLKVALMGPLVGVGDSLGMDIITYNIWFNSRIYGNTR